MSMNFKLNKVAIFLFKIIPSFGLISQGFAAELQSYNPIDNDSKVGQLTVSSGTESLTGNQQFVSGKDGAVQTTLGKLNSAGKIISGYSDVIDKERISIGAQNKAVTVIDPTTGGNTTFNVFDTDKIVDSALITDATDVNDIVNVNDEQYIDMRVANVNNNGTLNVNIGKDGGTVANAENSWSLAAKQSTVFDVNSDGSSGDATLNWNSNNHVSFFNLPTVDEEALTYTVRDLVKYTGLVSVTTIDGKKHSFIVATLDTLKNYNNWLISQLQIGNLNKSDYAALFKQAYSVHNVNVEYKHSATPPDEVFEGRGTNTFINAKGNGSKVNVAADKTLEVANINGGVINATDGATVTIDGKVSGTGGDTIKLKQESKGTNNGVINGNFYNQNDGTGGDKNASGSGAAVSASDNSTFDNFGVINVATKGGSSQGIKLTGGSQATNSGDINVGINASSSSGDLSGVLVSDAASSFTNKGDGTIYVGRSPENKIGEGGTDVAINQDKVTSGIRVDQGGTGVNDGQITLGKLVQNAAGMSAKDSDSSTLINNGTIDVNSAAAAVPNESFGMLVTNAGKDGNIKNNGTINLSGVNGIGIKVVAEDGKSSSASSTADGIINVAGDADPSSGTRNFGVWVEGQNTGTATAHIDSEINLTGDGAIGVHARGNAVIDISSNSVPIFSDGSNQIGFFAYGPQAKFNVIDVKKFDVTTKDSVLFRLENGAKFDGTELTLTTSGENSIALVGTGASGTEIDTKGAKIHITGKGSTGMVIEGGAIGVIDAATEMQLSGENAIGAIADGQKHDLSGKNTGSVDKNTTLTSSAKLDSQQNGLTGYIARNQSKLTNSGEINFTGANSTGLRIESGATGNNTGNITINNGGTGISVESDSHVTTANTSGIINVQGGNADARTKGISATGDKAVVNLKDGSTVNLNGVGAIGAEAVSGAQINLNDAAKVVFNNTDQIAYHAVGKGSAINSASTQSDVTTDRSVIYRLDDGATLSLSDSAIMTASGNASTGVIASGNSSIFNDNSAVFNVTGEQATGSRIEGGAAGVFGSSSQIHLSGERAVGVLIDNQRTALNNKPNGEENPTIVESAATLDGSGSSTIGYHVVNGGWLKHSGQVNLTGSNATGIRVNDGATVENTGKIHVTNGTGIDVIGGKGVTTAEVGTVVVDNGTAGVRVSDGAKLLLDGKSDNITTSGTAHGILIDTGAAALQSTNTVLNINGNGNGIENAAEIGNVLLTNDVINVKNGSGIRTATAFNPQSTVKVNVQQQGVGINLTKADDSTADSDFELGEGYQVTVNGTNGTGIRANTTGNLLTSASVAVNSADGGAALVAGKAKATLNKGSLVSKSTQSAVVDLTDGNGTIFENQGTITAASPTNMAINGSQGNDTILMNVGAIMGDVRTGDGSDTIKWFGGTLNGSLTMGNGDKNSAIVSGVNLDETFHITSGIGADSQLTFDNIQSKGGSFAQDDLSKGTNLGTGWSTINFNKNTQWELTDNLKLASSIVNIDGTSKLLAGNLVNPIISGGQDNSVTVNNAGLIDLTNGQGLPGGSNTITIDGNLVSQNGSVNMVTILNQGGEIKNQHSDKVFVEGNAAGRTILNVTPSKLSSGLLTDLNKDGVIQATEGITLAQVAGNAAADSFVLKGNYLAVGPWNYKLYAFAPGESDAAQKQLIEPTSNGFWDYRLANAFVCKDGIDCTVPPGDGTGGGGRLQLIPQAPSYISSLVGTSYYNSAIIEDLHKRLGEIRHERSLPEGKRTEMFMRYVGSNVKHKTNIGHQDFGYDFKMKYSGYQIGVNLFKLDDKEISRRLGFAYMHGDSQITPYADDGYSKSKMKTDSFALYYTQLRENENYFDAAVAWNLHRGHTSIDRDSNVGEMDGHSWIASIETGYPYIFDNGIRIEPQLQIMYQRISMYDFIDHDNVKVEPGSYGQTIGRVGVRVNRTWIDDKQNQYTPYLRLNYYHSWGGDPKVFLSSADNEDINKTFTGSQYGRMWEVGLGGSATFLKDITLYSEVDYRHEVSRSGIRGWRWSLGARWDID